MIYTSSRRFICFTSVVGKLTEDFIYKLYENNKSEIGFFIVIHVTGV